MFFACTIYITLVIARYATLAKLIRDSRANIENDKLKFNNQFEKDIIQDAIKSKTYEIY